VPIDLSAGVNLASLVATVQGRHLLLISLLEDLNGPTWALRCLGQLSYLLPPSLRSLNQPLQVPEGGLNLVDIIKSDGNLLSNSELSQQFSSIAPPELRRTSPEPLFSFYNSKHRHVLTMLVDWVLSMEFLPALSLLVKMKELASTDLFVEVLTLSVVGRPDCGLVMPDREATNPELFYCKSSPPEESYGKDSGDQRNSFDRGDLEDNVGETFDNGSMDPDKIDHGVHLHGADDGAEEHHRHKRQAMVDWTWRRSMGDPRYFREDPRYNSHHAHWHSISGGVHRRGEVFYYMHSQMLARYDAERLSMGLGRTRPLLPADWVRPIPAGYDARMPGYTARVAGRIMGTSRILSYNNLLRRIDRGEYGNYNPASGIDSGIVRLGSFVEEGIHNWGHSVLSGMRIGSGQTAIGTTTGSARDPMFYRWHALIDSIFGRYKNSLGPYSAQDLGFDGVTVTGARIRSSNQPDNVLMTGMVRDTVAMSSLVRGTRGSQSLQVTYNRMDHVLYTLEVTLNARIATSSIVRVFLVSSSQPSIVIEMDKWLARLAPGENRIIRREEDAPHISRRPTQSLRGLQRLLVTGRMSQHMFNWAGCGWPISLNIPTGSAGGSAWQLLVIASPLMPNDLPTVQQWERAGRVSWSYCGVLRGQVPDSRPLGFPMDRPSTGTRLGALVNQHSNIAATPVIIRRGRTQGRGPAPGGSGTAGRRPPRPSTPPPQPVRSSPPTVALAGGRPIVQPQFRQPAPWRPAPQQPTPQQPALLRPVPLRSAPLRPANLRPASLRPIPLRRTWAPRRDWNRRPVVNNFRRQWRRRRW